MIEGQGELNRRSLFFTVSSGQYTFFSRSAILQQTCIQTGSSRNFINKSNPSQIRGSIHCIRVIFGQFTEKMTFRQTRISKYILHFSPLYAILTLLISAAVLLLYLHRFKASHFRLVPYRNIYPTMNVTV